MSFPNFFVPVVRMNLLKRLSDFVETLACKGIPLEMSPHEAKRVRLVNRLCLYVMAAGGVYACIMYAVRIWPSAWFATVVAVSPFVPFWLNVLGRRQWARHAVMGLMYLILLMMTRFFTHNFYTQFTLLLLPAVSVLLYQRVNFLGQILVGLAAYGVSRWILANTTPLINATYPMLYEGFMATVNCVGFFLVIYFFQQESEEKARAIIEKNRELQQALADQAHFRNQLEAANRELQTFATLASHDMKEPLRTIASFSNLMCRRLPADADASSREFLGFINDAAQRMARLLDDLIAFARAGRVSTEAQMVDLNLIFEKTRANLLALSAQKEATIRAENLPKVVGHATLYTQLFQNLIANGLKFQRADATPKIVVAFQNEGVAGWQLCFSDNGIGIPQEFQGQIFQPFHRLHNHSEFEGSGIGLATCKKIVDFYGGGISVESEVGIGTCFRLHFSGQLVG